MKQPDPQKSQEKVTAGPSRERTQPDDPGPSHPRPREPERGPSSPREAPADADLGTVLAPKVST
jgi:hypothetical protein